MSNLIQINNKTDSDKIVSRASVFLTSSTGISSTGGTITGSLFTLKTYELDTGAEIYKGDILTIEGGNNILVERNGNTITIEGSGTSGITTLNSGAGITVTGSGTSRTISTWIDDETLSYITTGSTLMLGVNTSYYDNRYSSTGHTHSTYLVKTNNLSDLSNTSTARTNLGLGTMSVMNSGGTDTTYRNNIGNDVRFAYKSHTHNYVVPPKIFEKPIFLDGIYYTIIDTRGSFTTRSVVEDVLYTSPFVIHSDYSLYIDEIGIDVTTASSTSGTAKIFIFENNNGIPGDILATYSVSGLNSTGFKSVSADFTFNKSELYWIGCNFSVACSVRSITNTYSMSLGLSGGTSTTPFISLEKSFYFATFPSPDTYGTFSVNNLNTGTTIAVKFRYKTPVVIPATPTNLSIENSTIPSNVDAEWFAVGGATSYIVEYRVNGGTVTQEEVYSAVWNGWDYDNGDYVEIRVASKNSAGTSSFTSWTGVYVLSN